MQARRIIKRFKPDVVVSLGGLPVAGGLAARLSGVPLVIHEQNAVRTTNKVLSRLATRTYAPTRMRLAVVQ